MVLLNCLQLIREEAVRQIEDKCSAYPTRLSGIVRFSFFQLDEHRLAVRSAMAERCLPLAARYLGAMPPPACPDRRGGMVCLPMAANERPHLPSVENSSFSGGNDY